MQGSFWRFSFNAPKPCSQEYVIHKSGAAPELGVLALKGCMRTSAEPARQSLHDLMRGHPGTRYRTPAPPASDALVLTPWHSQPCAHFKAPDSSGTGAPLAHRSVRARASPALEPLHLSHTTVRRSAPVRGSAPRRNRYVEAPTPWQPLHPFARFAGDRVAASKRYAPTAGAAKFLELHTLANCLFTDCGTRWCLH